MTPVKNEAWILPLFLQSASIWADYIIIADQSSTDGSREIASRFPKVVLIENDSADLDEEYRNHILPIATIKSQTVTYYGLTREQIVKFVNEDHPEGVDRFVPLGKSMDFTLVWDGYDLIETLSRIVNVV